MCVMGSKNLVLPMVFHLVEEIIVFMTVDRVCRNLLTILMRNKLSLKPFQMYHDIGGFMCLNIPANACHLYSCSIVPSGIAILFMQRESDMHAPQHCVERHANGRDIDA